MEKAKKDEEEAKTKKVALMKKKSSRRLFLLGQNILAQQQEEEQEKKENEKSAEAAKAADIEAKINGVEADGESLYAFFKAFNRVVQLKCGYTWLNEVNASGLNSKPPYRILFR